MTWCSMSVAGNIWAMLSSAVKAALLPAATHARQALRLPLQVLCVRPKYGKLARVLGGNC